MSEQVKKIVFGGYQGKAIAPIVAALVADATRDEQIAEYRAICRQFLRDTEPPTEFCDVCPHALALHNPDGSCGCGMDCATIRASRQQPS